MSLRFMISLPYMQVKGRINAWYLFPIILATASLTYLISDYFFTWPSTNGFVKVDDRFTGEAPPGETLKFFQDTLIIASEDISDVDRFVLEVELNRKEVSVGKFVHFYTANLFQHGERKQSKTNFYADSETLEPNAFLLSFENAIFDDLSTRETYAFSLAIDEEQVRVVLDDLNGDFITKNNLAYTRYLSAGTGTLFLGDKSIRVNAALEKIYSNDHGQYLYFPGVNELESTTHRFLVWDEENNFYLLDMSTVREDNPYYRAHTWVLYKNATQEYSQKFFSAKLDFQDRGATKAWDIYIPGLNTTLKLSTTDPTDAIWSTGTAIGTAESETGVKNLYGSFNYKRE